MTWMNDKLRNKIWKRDKGTCQKCGRNLMSVIDPIEIIKEELSTISEITISKWYQSCWKCGNETPVVSYNFNDGYYDRKIGDVDKLDTILMEKYSFVKRKYSHTRGEEVIANTCIHCHALQGNFYVGQDLFEMRCEEVDLDKLIDIMIPNELKPVDLFDVDGDEDLKPYEVQDTKKGHVHHIDTDRYNNNYDNLLLLCSECHRDIHLSNDSEFFKPRTKKNNTNPSQKYKYVKCSECNGRARVSITEKAGNCKKCRDYMERRKEIKENNNNNITSVLDWNRKYSFRRKKKVDESH